jgi:prepilin-type N-terminal cleavage/methylation domain-containing protein
MIRNRRRGFTLSELTIAVGVFSLISGMMGYLIIMTARNTALINKQISGQNACSIASEQISQMLRDSYRFSTFPADGVTTEYTRLQFAGPHPYEQSTTGIQAIAYDAAKKTVNYYADASKLQTPTKSFKNISDFGIRYETMYHVGFRVNFEYAGFAMPFTTRNMQHGQFWTEIIARNHMLNEGSDDYDDNTTVTTNFARLY